MNLSEALMINEIHYQKRQLKVGIVGAGPAGGLAACLFSKAGHQVTLFERKSQVDRKVCGEYLCPMGVKLLKNLGLLGFQDVSKNQSKTVKGLQAWPKLDGMNLISPNGVKVKCLFPKINGIDSGASLNRKIFDQGLIDLAMDMGAEIKEGITVTSAIKKSDQWLVRVCLLETSSIDSDEQKKFKQEEHYFDLLIVADGRQSKIGHFLGHIKKINTDRAALHLYLPRHAFWGERLGEMHIFNDGSYCGINPLDDQEVNFSIVVDSLKLKEKRPIEIINEYLKKSPELLKSFDYISHNQESDIKVVTALKNKNHFIAGNGLAYVGDAAGFIDPLTGEGIYNALSSSLLLFNSISKSENLEHALFNYRVQKKLSGLEKSMLNYFFQYLIKRPRLVEFVAHFLKKSSKRSDVFIGIIGNIYKPLEGILKMIVA